MKNNKLAICYTSASRPDLLKRSAESAASSIIYFDDIEEELRSNNRKWILHEDFCNEEESNKIIHWAKYSGYFDEIITSNPRIGLIGSCKRMIDHCWKYDYILRLCDDFVFTKHVDVDKLIKIMDNHDDINQIVFNKRINNARKGDFIKHEESFDGVKLTTSPRWSSLNSIWRTDFIMSYWFDCWEKIKDFDEKKFGPWKEFTECFCDDIGIDPNESDWRVTNKKIGSWLYGGIGDDNGCVNVHIGENRSRVFG